jgi:8-hydroxy-5-deazaflavin:NADPH oxidoreductase
MKIGIIGSGEMGSFLASKFSKLGHSVAIANSRGPASLKHLAENFCLEAATVEDAIRDKDIVIISIVERNVQDLPKNLFRQLPEHAVVIDTMNYYPNLRGGAIPALDQSGIDSAWVQEHLGVPIIKAFNAILATSLKDKGMPEGNKGRIAIPISGNSKRSKEVVHRLVSELGFDAYDIGSNGQSWKQQPGSPIYGRDITAAEMQQRLNAMEADGFGLSDVVAKRKADELLMATDYPAYLESLT